MKQVNEIIVPILNNEYKVIVCWGKEKEVNKVARGWGHKKAAIDLTNFRGQTYYTKDCHPVIALPKFPKTPEQIGTLAHEAVHAVNNIFDKVGESKTDEIFAHSVGAIVREVLS